MANSIRQRNSAGLQDAVDRLVDGLKQMASKQVKGTTVIIANATRQDEEAIRVLSNALTGPMPSAVQINTNASASKFKFMMGRDIFSDNVVL